jgi:hypothetical protein
MEKNFEKTVDPDINLGHNINSDRGNPSDLWNNLKQFGAATVAPSGCSVINLCKRISAPKQEAGVHQTLGAE